MNRLAGLAEAGYHQGQWLGTKGAALLGEKFTVDPLSKLGRGIDVAWQGATQGHQYRTAQRRIRRSR